MWNDMSARDDLEIKSSYTPASASEAKPVPLNDILKQWERERKEAAFKEDLLVWWAIIRAFFVVVLFILSVLFGSYIFYVYGW